MPDWTKPMSQTYEFYEVDPASWFDRRPVSTVTACNIDRDLSAETLGSANITGTEPLNDVYVRTYLVSVQNGIKERTCLGTHLVETPSRSFDGKVSSISMNAYTPLIELKENNPPLGYAILKNENVMRAAVGACEDNMRAPVVETYDSTVLHSDFVASTDEKWLSFISDLAANANHHLDLDAYGNVMFAPNQEDAALQPRWTYTDDNSSILYPELSLDKDYYGVPNVVEVIYSNGSGYYYGYAENNNPNSPVSIPNRGRRVTYRDTNPSLSGQLTPELVQAYAEGLLENLSKISVTVSYKHGYCPVRIGDCVYLNYTRAGLKNIKAKVISQSIECIPGCPVSETAVYTKDLLEG